MLEFADVLQISWNFLFQRARAKRVCGPPGGPVTSGYRNSNRALGKLSLTSSRPMLASSARSWPTARPQGQTRWCRDLQEVRYVNHTITFFSFSGKEKVHFQSKQCTFLFFSLQSCYEKMHLRIVDTCKVYFKLCRKESLKSQFSFTQTTTFVPIRWNTTAGQRRTIAMELRGACVDFGGAR